LLFEPLGDFALALVELLGRLAHFAESCTLKPPSSILRQGPEHNSDFSSSPSASFSRISAGIPGLVRTGTLTLTGSAALFRHTMTISSTVNLM
jgi:hypothetical protein